MRELSRGEHNANYANNYEEVKAVTIGISFAAEFVMVAFFFGYMFGFIKGQKNR